MRRVGHAVEVAVCNWKSAKVSAGNPDAVKGTALDGRVLDVDAVDERAWRSTGEDVFGFHEDPREEAVDVDMVKLQIAMGASVINQVANSVTHVARPLFATTIVGREADVCQWLEVSIYLRAVRSTRNDGLVSASADNADPRNVDVADIVNEDAVVDVCRRVALSAEVVRAVDPENARNGVHVVVDGAIVAGHHDGGLIRRRWAVRKQMDVAIRGIDRVERERAGDAAGAGEQDDAVAALESRRLAGSEGVYRRQVAGRARAAGRRRADLRSAVTSHVPDALRLRCGARQCDEYREWEGEGGFHGRSLYFWLGCSRLYM